MKAVLTLLLFGAALLILLAGCVQPANPTLSATQIILPSPLPDMTSTPGQTGQPSGGNLPANLSGYELLANSTGEASYSGYACVMAPVGCACDQPIIQRVRFNFTANNKLLYEFRAGSQPASTWELGHAGVNQWDYRAPIKGDDGSTQAYFLALITFTQEGYLVTQAANMASGAIVQCPDVVFHRLAEGAAP